MHVRDDSTAAADELGQPADALRLGRERQARQSLAAPRRPARTTTAPTISTDELARRFDAPGLTIVDLRPLHAFNGWRLDGESRGGHIPGAVALPCSWLDGAEDAELERLLNSKGIHADQEIVLYDHDATDAPSLRDRLAGAGYANVRSYGSGWQEWASDSALPVEQLPNYSRLVHVSWLEQLLGGGTPEAAPSGSYLLFHVNFGVPEEYEENHITGALYLDTNRLEDPADWNRRSPERARAGGSGAGDHRRHHCHPLRPRHRGRRQREVARAQGGADRGHPRRDDPVLRGRRRRAPPRRRLRPLGAEGQPASRHSCESPRRYRRSAPRSRCDRR